jgi:tRNA 2-thiouridine synthesizing protein A
MTSGRPLHAGSVVIDGGNRACVALLLELRDHIRDLPAGTVIHLIASDPAAPIDLPAWCHLTGHVYLGCICPTGPTYALRTIADPVVTDTTSPWRRASWRGPSDSCQ